jgi:hypothetical protein
MPPLEPSVTITVASLEVQRPKLELVEDSIFNQARCKVYRALRHAYEASDVWRLSIQQQAANIGPKVDGGNGLGQIHSGILMPLDVGLAVGDSLRCLRSALDYLISALARQAGISDENTIFPFNEKRDEVSKSFKTFETKKMQKRQGALFTLAQKFPELERIILNDVRPHLGTDNGTDFGDLLYRIITSDNIDKHRLMTPTIEEQHLDLTGPISITGITVQGGYGLGSLFAAPAHLVRNMKGSIAVDISFPDTAKRLSGRPVFKTLVEGAQMVVAVIAMFEAEFGSRGQPEAND